jgi:hypothetical protein
MKGIKLITRADDAGLNRTVNKAIRSSVKQGIVRNISLLAPAPAIVHTAECFGDLAGEVDFGLQVCLIAEWENVRWGPVAGAAQVPTIVRNDGTFAFDIAELQQLNPAVDEIMSEVNAQYEKLTALGFSLSYLEYIDYGGIPGVDEELAVFARSNNLVPAPARTAAHADYSPVAQLPGWSGPGEHPGTELADHLATVKEGTYLLAGCPAFKTDEIKYLKKPGDTHGEALLSRNRQRRMFADIEIVDYCENVGIELIRYSDLNR